MTLKIFTKVNIKEWSSILPSKRARKIQKNSSIKEDLAELKFAEQSIESEPSEESIETQEEDVSLDNLKDEEIASEEQKDSESTNS